MGNIRSNTSLVKRRIEIIEDSVEGILSYDKDNAYPQRVIRTVGGSGTGRNCVRTNIKLVSGRAFVEEELNKLKIDRDGKTLKSLLRMISRDFAYFAGLAIHVNYNVAGKPVEWQHVPFEDCRLTIPDDFGYVSKIAISKEWERRYKRQRKAKPVFIHRYNPDPAVVQKQILDAGGIDKYKGQIFWFSSEGENTYPLSIFDPVLLDMYTENQIKLTKSNNVTDGFMPSAVLTTIGKFEDEDEKDKFTEDLNEFQGAENAGKIFHIEVDDKEQIPKLDTLTYEGVDKQYEYTERSVIDRTIEATGVPGILIGIRVAGQLGTSQEFNDAKQYYDEYTEPERLMFQEVLSSLMGSIAESKTFALIPYTGIKTEQTKTPLATTLGVGGTQSLVELISSALPYEQKLGSLVVVFGLKEEDAKLILGEKPSAEPAEPAAPAQQQ